MLLSNNNAVVLKGKRAVSVKRRNNVGQRMIAPHFVGIQGKKPFKIH